MEVSAIENTGGTAGEHMRPLFKVFPGLAVYLSGFFQSFRSFRNGLKRQVVFRKHPLNPFSGKRRLMRIRRI